MSRLTSEGGPNQKQANQKGTDQQSESKNEQPKLDLEGEKPEGKSADMSGD